MYPITNLQPGATGSEVLKLQSYLVSQGFMTQAQMNTGPGTYGPQTKAAVAAFQQSRGIDTAGNPGFWGPRTIASLQSQPPPGGTPPTPPGGTPPTPPGGTPPTPPGGTPPTPPGGTPPPATAAFKNSAAYKALSPELRELVDLGFSSFTGTEAQQGAFSDALTQAQALADPYAKSQLALFKAEYGTAIAKTTSDFNTQREILDRTRNELAQDLASGKEFLSLENQADMAKTLRGYDEDLLTIADQAAEKGITFATGARSRALAEERRVTQFQDVVQSSSRRFNFQQKELELKAARGDTSAAKQLEALATKRGFDIESIGQAAEKVLGSTGVPATEGFTPVGGALGSIEQERRKSIFDIASFEIPK